MKPLEFLSEYDKSLIHEYIRVYGGSEEGDTINPASTDWILRYWNEAKESLADLFSKELILSKEVSIAKPHYEIQEDMRKHIPLQTYYNKDGDIHERHPFINALDNFTAKFFNLYYYRESDSLEGRDLPPFYKRYLEMQPSDLYELYRNIRLLLTDEIADELWVDAEIVIYTGEGEKDKIKFTKGTKMMKLLGKLARAFDLEEFEDFRLRHSQVLNQKKLEGELCISIHPLDFMTMSDNDCDWVSCMTWTDYEGEYRSGTVEMMNSPVVVVAYLKGKRDMKLFSGKPDVWNNKKWRCLYVIDKNMIVPVKGYPYCNDELDLTVINWLKELAEKAWGVKYEDTPKTLRNCKIEREEANFEIKLYTQMMYNDMGGIPHISYFNEDFLNELREKEDNYRHELCYSGKMECMCCGIWLESFRVADCAVICQECSGVMKCDRCGEFHPIDDFINYEGMNLCSYCYEETELRCIGCDEIIDRTTDNHICLNVYSWNETPNGPCFERSYYYHSDESCLNEEDSLLGSIHNKTLPVPTDILPFKHWHDSYYIGEQRMIRVGALTEDEFNFLHDNDWLHPGIWKRDKELLEKELN